MSLVAYVSSDEDGSGSDAEENTRPSFADFQSDEGTTKQNRNFVNECKHSKPIDLDEKMQPDPDTTDYTWEVETENKAINKRSIFSLLPPPTKERDSYILEEDDASDLIKLKSNIPAMEETNIPSNRAEETVENDDQSKSNNIKRSMKLLLPKPKMSGKDASKQTMKITIPNLADIDSDSDEECSKKKKRKIQPGKKGTGLIGSLPQPKNSIRTGSISIDKPIRRKQNRSLIPYTLSKKKPEESKKNAAIDKDSGSESDGETSTNFFSLSEVSNAEGNAGNDTDNSIIHEELPGISRTVKSVVKLPDATCESNHVGEDTLPQIVYSKSLANNDKKHEQFCTDSAKSVISNQGTSYLQEKTSTKSSPVINIQKLSPVATASRDFKSSESNSVAGPYYGESVVGPYDTKPYDKNITGPYGGQKASGPYPTKSDTTAYNQNITGPYGGHNVSGHYPTKSDTSTYDQSITGPYGGHNVSRPYNKKSDIAAYNQNITGPYGGQDVNRPYHQVAAEASHQSMFGGYGNSVSSSYLNPQPTDYHSQHGASENIIQQAASEENLDFEQLRRLQGKKERRKQPVNFIDISAPSMTLDQASFLKNAPDEPIHVSDKLKSDNPSSQQRKKHQITYLAFQAKEKEQELRKTWSTSSHSRRQSQQKYGF